MIRSIHVQVCGLLLCLLVFALHPSQQVLGQDAAHPAAAQWHSTLGEDFTSVSFTDLTLTLELSEEALVNKKAVMPRLCAPIRSLFWKGAKDRLLKFVPEPNEWVFSWKEPPAGSRSVDLSTQAGLSQKSSLPIGHQHSPLVVLGIAQKLGIETFVF